MLNTSINDLLNSVNNTSDVLPALICADTDGNHWRICLSVDILISTPFNFLYLTSDLVYSLTLIWEGVYPLLRFPWQLRSSKSCKPICSIKQFFIRHIPAKFGITHLPHSPDIGQNSEGLFAIFKFPFDPLKTKIGITPEPVFISTWNLDQ